MLMKALALAGVAFSCVSASPMLPALTQSGIAPADHPEIVRVICLVAKPKSVSLIYGTAFRVGPTTLLTAAHVSHNPNCHIDGKPFKEIATAGDFSILTMQQPDPRWLSVDCGGYVKGRKYRALGFARGLETQTEVDVEGTGVTDDGQAVLKGVFTVIPGQSGGPILDDETGRVVGVVNTYQADRGLSGSVELKTTSVCKA